MPRIQRIGVGSLGVGVIDRLTALLNVGPLIAIDSDRQELDGSRAGHKLLIGENLLKGESAKGDPGLGRAGALESADEIRGLLSFRQYALFIVTAMGGGTGAGAAPVVAELAREIGLRVFGIVYLPNSHASGRETEEIASALEAFRKFTQATILIPGSLIPTSESVRPQTNSSRSTAIEWCVRAFIGVTDLSEGVDRLVNYKPSDFSCVLYNSDMAVMGYANGPPEEDLMKIFNRAIAHPFLSELVISDKRAMLNFGYAPGVEWDSFNGWSDVIDRLSENIAPGHDTSICNMGENITVVNQKTITLIISGFKQNPYARNFSHEQIR